MNRCTLSSEDMAYLEAQCPGPIVITNEQLLKDLRSDLPELVRKLVDAENAWTDAKLLARIAKRKFDAARRSYDAAVKSANSVPPVAAPLGASVVK